MKIKARRKLRKYKRENLENALIAVKSGQMSQTKASQTYGVPQSTIATRISLWKRAQFLNKNFDT